MNVQMHVAYLKMISSNVNIFSTSYVKVSFFLTLTLGSCSDFGFFSPGYVYWVRICHLITPGH